MFSFFVSLTGGNQAGKEPVLRVTEFTLDVVVATDVELIRLANIELRIIMNMAVLQGILKFGGNGTDFISWPSKMT